MYQLIVGAEITSLFIQKIQTQVYHNFWPFAHMADFLIYLTNFKH